MVIFYNPREVLDELKKYNAEKMEKHCLDSGHTPHTVAFSPSTDVYKIFEIFLSKYVK